MTQTMMVSTDSVIGEALLSSEWPNGNRVALSLKNIDSGASMFRGLITKWSATGATLEVEFEDWDAYFGNVAAGRFRV